MAGARGLLINITGGEDMTLFEVDQAANRIREEVDDDANIIFGSAIDENLAGKVRVSVVATGIETPGQKQAERPRLVAVSGQMPAQVIASPVGLPQAPAAGTGGPLPLRQGAAPATGMAPRPPAPQPIPQMRQTQQPVHASAPRPMPMQPAPMTAPPVVSGDAQSYEAPTMEAPMQEGASGQMTASGYETVSDAPLPPRQIPAHLQQPLRPQAPAAKRPAAPRAGGLFAESPRAEASAPPPRRSLFGIVTGRLRASLPSSANAEPSSHGMSEAEASAEAQPAVPEGPRAHAQPAGGEEMGLDIPAFLRRQTS